MICLLDVIIQHHYCVFSFMMNVCSNVVMKSFARINFRDLVNLDDFARINFCEIRKNSQFLPAKVPNKVFLSLNCSKKINTAFSLLHLIKVMSKKGTAMKPKMLLFSINSEVLSLTLFCLFVLLTNF